MRAALTRWFRSELRPRFEAVEVVTATSKRHNERCGAWFSYWWLGAVQLQTRCGQIGTVELACRYPTWVQDRPGAVFQPTVRAAIAVSSLPAATDYRAEHRHLTLGGRPHRTIAGRGGVGLLRHRSVRWA